MAFDGTGGQIIHLDKSMESRRIFRTERVSGEIISQIIRVELLQLFGQVLLAVDVNFLIFNDDARETLAVLGIHIL